MGQSAFLDDQELAAIATVGATSTSAAMGPLSFPTLSGVESGLTTQASPQLGGGMSGLSMPRASSLLLAGQGTTAYFAGPVMGPAGSIQFPSPKVGLGGSHVVSSGLYVGTTSVTAGQAQGSGGAMETEGAGQTLVVFTVTTVLPAP